LLDLVGGFDCFQSSCSSADDCNYTTRPPLEVGSHESRSQGSNRQYTVVKVVVNIVVVPVTVVVVVVAIVVVVVVVVVVGTCRWRRHISQTEAIAAIWIDSIG